MSVDSYISGNIEYILLWKNIYNLLNLFLLSDLARAAYTLVSICVCYRSVCVYGTEGGRGLTN